MQSTNIFFPYWDSKEGEQGQEKEHFQPVIHLLIVFLAFHRIQRLKERFLLRCGASITTNSIRNKTGVNFLIHQPETGRSTPE